MIFTVKVVLLICIKQLNKPAMVSITIIMAYFSSRLCVTWKFNQ